MTSQNVIMGFDYGTRKIGIAVGQLITKTANPIAIISARDGVPDWSEIEQLILEWQPCSTCRWASAQHGRNRKRNVPTVSEIRPPINRPIQYPAPHY